MTVEPLTRAEAVDQLVTETGRAPEVAEAMVRDYLDETSARLGYFPRTSDLTRTWMSCLPLTSCFIG